MRRLTVILSIFFFWLCIAGLSLLTENKIGISRITSAIAMFSSGAAFIIYRILDSIKDINLEKKILYYIHETSFFLLTIGFFIYIFMIDINQSNEALHEISRIILNSATILLVINCCAERISSVK